MAATSTQAECLANEKIMQELDTLIGVLCDHGLQDTDGAEEYIKKNCSGDWESIQGSLHHLGQQLEFYGKFLQENFNEWPDALKKTGS